MLHRQLAKISSNLCAIAIVSSGVLLTGCVPGPEAGATSAPNANTNGSPTAAAPAPTPPALPPLEAREPENYSIVERVTIQPTGSAPQANIPQLQFAYARMGASRRLSFVLPDPVGEVIYLDKTTLKYLIFPKRNQYVELDPQELGFQLGELMSPPAAIDRLKRRAQYELQGIEDVGGRPANKYRFRGSADTHTSAGTAQADSILYVDQETGLPLRSEIEATSTSGAGARIVTTTDSLQLIPTPTLFEVPTQMKKVSSAEVKQQVQNFVAGIRVFADYLKQQAAPSPAAGQ